MSKYDDFMNKVININGFSVHGNAVRLIKEAYELGKDQGAFDALESYNPKSKSALENQKNHPLQQVFDSVIDQVTKGKGVRHGGDEIPYLDQKWRRISDLWGECGLLWQAQKNLEECANKEGEYQENGLLETIAYIAKFVLYKRLQDKK